MARLPRLVIPQQPHYIFQQGNNRQPIFCDSSDFAAFLGWLRDAARQFKVAIHAYLLTEQRVHLLATPADEEGLGRMMQWVGRHYVPYFNRKYGHAGTLWQGRFKASVIEAPRYLLLCYRYLESHPVRAGLAATAAQYPWSSQAHHVGARVDPLVTDHPLYWSLGNTPFEREAHYRALLEQALPPEQVALLDAALLKGWVLGDAAFQQSLAQQLNRRVAPAKRGRPRRPAAARPEPNPDPTE
ncbi:transposase [Herminiimonas sp. CN]|uniref:transposase n=1 Tax=Herminiimonas sp. CN TaxID=1349818 RepID=UPI000473FF47|nr:transposase [Herminiimonas sp. CN]